MNINHLENGGKKAFLSNPKRQYGVSQCGEHGCCANNKNNGDCYECQCLSHFIE